MCKFNVSHINKTLHVYTTCVLYIDETLYKCISYTDDSLRRSDEEFNYHLCGFVFYGWIIYIICYLSAMSRWVTVTVPWRTYTHLNTLDPTLARISLHAHTPLDTPLTTCKFQYSPIHLYIYIYPYLHTLLHTPILAYKLQISCQQYSACPYTFLYFPAAARAPHVVLSQSEGLWNIYFSLRFCLWNTLQAVALLKKNIIKKIAILANL